MRYLASLVIVSIVAAASVGTADAQTPTPKKEAPKAPDAKAPKPEVSAQEAEKFLAFFNKMVDAATAHKEDCTKMAAALNGLIDANMDLIKKANQAKAEGKDLPKAVKEKMMSRVKELGSSMTKCGADAKVQAAMMRMEDKKKTETKAPADTKKDTKTPAPTR